MILIHCVAAIFLSCVAADNLYPKCAGEELDQRISNAEGDVKLTDITGMGTKLVGDCIAFQVTSVQEGGCAVPHQTDLPYRIYFRAVGTHSHYTAEYDIDDVLGGSVNSLTFSTTEEATFGIYFRNYHSDPNCLMRVRAIVTTSFVTETAEEIRYAAPSLVNIVPATVFAHHVNATVMVFRTQDAPLSTDEVTFISEGDQCSNPVGDVIRATRVTDPAKVSQYLVGYSNPSMHTVWKYYFDTSGTYAICYHHGTPPSERVAFLSVFGGNPRYFDVVSGAGPRGELYLYQAIVIRFYGTDLDTRSDGDKAKLVEDIYSCAQGPAAGGVPLATDLGPADDWGPLTTHTDWSLTITNGGSFKVCYKRATGPWTEVPLIYDVPSAAIIHESTTAAPLPIPTDPQNKLPCAVAPSRTTPVQGNTLLKLTLQSTGSLPSYFTGLLCQLLCIPQSSLVLYPVTVDAAGHIVVTLDIQCEVHYCNSDERKYYVVYTFQHNPTALKELKLFAVDERVSSGINVIEQGTSQPQVRHGGLGSTFLICLTIIAVTGMTIYGVLRYRQTQHQFIEFGIDEDDDATQIGGQTSSLEPVVRGVIPSSQAI